MKRRALLKFGAAGSSTLLFTSLAKAAKSVEADVVVVGGGAAGLSAAVAAAQKSMKVVLVEKNRELGGNTWISGGFYSAVNPKLQKPMGINDSFELFYEQTLAAGKRMNNPQLARIMCFESLNSVRWLESMGMQFHPIVMESIGALWLRCHKPLLPDGQGYIRTLSGEAYKLGVRLLFNTSLIDLLRNDRGIISGAILKSSDGKTILIEATHGVILAAGGFGGNLAMVAQYNPNLKDATTDNVSSVSGEVLKIAASHGVALDYMDQVECLPGCPKGRTLRIRFHVDVPRFVLVDSSGNRFIREDSPRDELRDALLNTPGRIAFTIVDQEGYKSFSSHIRRDAVLGVESGDAFISDTLKELAQQIRVPPENLIKTIEIYNEGVRLKKDVLGKHETKLLYEIKKPPFWAGIAGITVHSTLGGLRIDECTRCLTDENTVVPGLFAAGEITAGVHGANRVGGNGLLDAVVFGRLAGEKAAQGI